VLEKNWQLEVLSRFMYIMPLDCFCYCYY